jgi:hypothetical protein
MVQQQRKIQANRLEGNHWNQNDIDERVAQLCNKIYLVLSWHMSTEGPTFQENSWDPGPQLIHNFRKSQLA